MWYINGRIGKRNIQGGAWVKNADSLEGCILDGVGPEVESAPRFFEGIFKNEDGEDRLDLKWTEEAAGGEGKVLHLHKKTEYSQSTPKSKLAK